MHDARSIYLLATSSCMVADNPAILVRYSSYVDVHNRGCKVRESIAFYHPIWRRLMIIVHVSCFQGYLPGIA